MDLKRYSVQNGNLTIPISELNRIKNYIQDQFKRRPDDFVAGKLYCIEAILAPCTLAKKPMPRTKYNIVKIDENEQTLQTIVSSDILIPITLLRELAFDSANSGKYGWYPDDETFSDAVEEGFSPNGLQWTARDETVFLIKNA